MIRSLATALGLLWCSSLPALADPIDYDRLDARLTQLMREDDMVGLAVAVVEDGEIAFAQGYGVTHLGGRNVNENTVFRWASLSKGVAGSLAGLAAANGDLSLNDTVNEFGTSLRLPKGGEATATLLDLLSHRLGIVSNAYDTRLEDGRDPRDIRRALGKLKPICAVGGCHTYQNVAFDAISEVVLDATGEFYVDLADDLLFEPLGMTSASLTRDGLVNASNHARPHSRTRRAGGVNENYYRVPAAGGVNSSILDLAKYMQAQMGLFPDVLPQAVLDEIHAPRVRTLREERSIKRRWGRVAKAEYALGWRVYDYVGNRVIGHRGAVNGYRAMIMFDPERDTGLAVLWNSGTRRPVGLQFEVMDMLYGLPAQDWLGVGELTAANPPAGAG